MEPTLHESSRMGVKSVYGPLLLLLLLSPGCGKPPAAIAAGAALQPPQPGSHTLRVITPTLLELEYVTVKKPEPAGLTEWDFVDRSGRPKLPPPGYFDVKSQGQAHRVKEVGFKRRAAYAPLRPRDLRLANYLYLRLETPIPEGHEVTVVNPGGARWPDKVRFTARVEPHRWSPVIHVNQTGYLPRLRKVGIVGYYLGSMGELDSGFAATDFKLVDHRSEKEVFRGKLAPRPDQGFERAAYQKVLQADFTAFDREGEYRLVVDGLGSSFPFRIDEGSAAAFARTYALGLYHQRCGTDNRLPFTRFTHGPCHTGPAEVPTMSTRFAAVNETLKRETANAKERARHKAPALSSVASSLYPFVNKGPVNVRGGHHDAGDYSKYTINSAGLIHHLVFAADVFDGVKDLDNLGLPESGDGTSDILQEAKWEADFLARMQDSDGGFYFLVYPRDRRYEDNVLPDKGDPQVVFPKNTAVTAAASAALAQCASSPSFRAAFPEAAKEYLEKARKGWDFLERALERHGGDGAYQKFTHYGDEFLHDDELAWAACELFLATGEERYGTAVMKRLRPGDPNTRKWGWWRLYDAWGCAIRSYAFAAKTGRMGTDKLNKPLAAQCQEEVFAAGQDQLRRSNQSAYGTSFPDETKRARSAGWYFFSDAAFDLIAAYHLEHPEKNDPRGALLDALVANLDYEQGCNPVNVVYLTGLGHKRQLEIVHQFAVNDERVLPPTGIPLGNIQAGISWIGVYGKEPAELSFPSDSAGNGAYPFYDRWTDAFNLSQEFVILHQARGLGSLAWLMARSSLKDQAWKTSPGEVAAARITHEGNPALRLTVQAPGLRLGSARVIWEGKDLGPAVGDSLVVPVSRRPAWVEAEAQLPDGRRVFARTNLSAVSN